MVAQTLQRGDRVRDAELGTIVDVRESPEGTLYLVAWDEDEPGDDLVPMSADELVRVYE